MSNTLYTNDNLFILNGLNSQSVDLIYLDPPFNTNRIYSAPVGSKAANTSFKDMWTWADINEFYLDTLATQYSPVIKFIASVGNVHSKAMAAYLTYMAQRLTQMHRVLKDTGRVCVFIVILRRAIMLKCCWIWFLEDGTLRMKLCDAIEGGQLMPISFKVCMILSCFMQKIQIQITLNSTNYY